MCRSTTTTNTAKKIVLRTSERSANDEPESLAPELTCPGTISRDRARKPNGRVVLQVLGRVSSQGTVRFFFVSGPIGKCFSIGGSDRLLFVSRRRRRHRE